MSGSTASAASAARPQKPYSILSHLGQPVSFTSGVFAGHTIRTELEEIQKADRSRKYARKDKRPLDPPSVVTCRFFEDARASSGSDAIGERELDPDHAALGIVCHVDLFLVPDEFLSESGRPSAPEDPLQVPSLVLQPLQGGTSYPRSSRQAPSPLIALPPMPPQYLHVSTQRAHHAQAPSTLGMAGRHSGHSPGRPTPRIHAEPVASSPIALNPHSLPDPDIVGWFGHFAIRESEKCTNALSGSTFMQTAVIDYLGRKTAIFVFSDLAVKIEGTFVLRYRVFTIYSHCAAYQGPGMPILAECYGGPFKIYSTKDFPGLSPSTDLTKFLALHGVRVNLREHERKRRRQTTEGRRGGAGSHPSSATHHPDSGGSDSDADAPGVRTMGRAGPSGSAESSAGSPTTTTYSPTTSPAASVRSIRTGSDPYGFAAGPVPKWPGPRRGGGR